MRTSLVAGALAAALAACSPDEGVPFNPNAVEEGVSALVERWADAGERGDFDSLAALYADEDGFAWIERGEVAYADYAAVIAGLDAAKAMNATIRNDVHDVAVTPLTNDIAAFHSGVGVKVASEAFSFAFDGVLSGVAVKRDGEWKFLQGAFSEKPAAE